ncbi:guanyl-specific ribonuclease pgl-1 [Aplysia californica]|uniref:Guanyl-specific ribonuclease pgl-1 n=1 Tax=Aplysia californica TaxID=6500 RepID=A0ABM0JNV8_APLCA|nr:guanyl-specific ribonuclease pgl-1 [Aplysia californica]XP_005098077.1 guanyl-specific ribonuclease pgl-1 [Aplysia californica]
MIPRNTLTKLTYVDTASSNLIDVSNSAVGTRRACKPQSFTLRRKFRAQHGTESDQERDPQTMPQRFNRPNTKPREQSQLAQGAPQKEHFDQKSHLDYGRMRRSQSTDRCQSVTAGEGPMSSDNVSTQPPLPGFRPVENEGGDNNMADTDRNQSGQANADDSEGGSPEGRLTDEDGEAEEECCYNFPDSLLSTGSVGWFIVCIILLTMVVSIAVTITDKSLCFYPLPVYLKGWGGGTGAGAGDSEIAGDGCGGYGDDNRAGCFGDSGDAKRTDGYGGNGDDDGYSGSAGGRQGLGGSADGYNYKDRGGSTGGYRGHGRSAGGAGNGGPFGYDYDTRPDKTHGWRSQRPWQTRKAPKCRNG